MRRPRRHVAVARVTLRAPERIAARPVARPTTVDELVSRAHLTLHAASGRAAAAANVSDLRDLYEADIAAISLHVSTLQTFAYPVARRHLPADRVEIDRLFALGREVERVLRDVQGQMHGDLHAVDETFTQLQDRLAVLTDDLSASESQLAPRLDAALGPAKAAALVASLLAADRRAPTRPHPFRPHTGVLSRPSFRICAAVDHVLDVMESRILPRAVTYAA